MFHPKWQRKLPIWLSSIFPKIQFIASTHSVIPFLGAPKNSVFLKVNRNKTTGIKLERIDIDIKNLLPNSILTSPIFDLEGEEIMQENNDNISDIRTEETYDEIQLNNEMHGLPLLKPVIEIFPMTYFTLFIKIIVQ